MGRISVTIEAPERGVATTMQLPDDIPVNVLVLNLVSELDLPHSQASMPISYGLESPRTGRNLGDGETLQSTGIQPNDHLHIRARVQAVPAVSDLQFQRLKRSFVHLRKPSLPSNIRPADAAGEVARLVVEQAPSASSRRTAPQPIAPPAATQPSGAQTAAPRAAQTAPTPAQVLHQPALAQPAVVAPPRTPPQPVVQPKPAQPATPMPVTQPAPLQPATPGIPLTTVRAPRGGFVKGILIGGGVMGLLVLMFLLGARSASTNGSSNTSSSVTVQQATVGAGMASLNATASQTDNPTVAPAQAVVTSALEPTAAPEPPSSQPAGQTSSASVPKPPIISRDSWGAQPPRGSNGSQQPTRIILTHDGQPIKSTTDAVTLLQSIQRNHFKRNWVDFAWHFAIDQNGAIYEGHDPTDRTDTSYDYDTNGMIVVGVLGDYDSQVPSPVQINAIVDLLSWLCSAYHIAPDQIFPHSQFANQSPRTNPKITSPGRNFDLVDIQRRVRDRLAGQ